MTQPLEASTLAERAGTMSERAGAPVPRFGFLSTERVGQRSRELAGESSSRGKTSGANLSPATGAGTLRRLAPDVTAGLASLRAKADWAGRLDEQVQACTRASRQNSFGFLTSPAIRSTSVDRPEGAKGRRGAGAHRPERRRLPQLRDAVGWTSVPGCRITGAQRRRAIRHTLSIAHYPSLT